MKKKFVILLLVAIFAISGTKATFAASGWQSLGSWTMSNSITVTSKDGGNLKVRVNGSQTKYSFKLVRNIAGNLWGPTQTTSGVSGDNSTTFSGLSKGASYRIYLDAPRGGSVNITVFD
ncbi:hypothetical protein SFC65_27720 [Priestia filamentosa]|uniref:hypothetical protein n=1 Tax=Priestia filamentosa TaxID=1402861 RepID=UPI000301509A|nr:hypothetical protein [Priestia filamentosa]